MRVKVDVMRRFILCGIFAAATLLTLGSTSAHAAAAAENYQFYCAQCHGLKGRADGPNAVESQPVSPRDHTSAVEMGKLTDEDIINAIEGGGAATSKSVLMPPFGKTLTGPEIAALKDYLRKLCKCR